MSIYPVAANSASPAALAPAVPSAAVAGARAAQAKCRQQMREEEEKKTSDGTPVVAAAASDDTAPAASSLRQSRLWTELLAPVVFQSSMQVAATINSLSYSWVFASCIFGEPQTLVEIHVLDPVGMRAAHLARKYPINLPEVSKEGFCNELSQLLRDAACRRIMTGADLNECKLDRWGELPLDGLAAEIWLVPPEAQICVYFHVDQNALAAHLRLPFYAAQHDCVLDSSRGICFRTVNAPFGSDLLPGQRVMETDLVPMGSFRCRVPAILFEAPRSVGFYVQKGFDVLYVDLPAVEFLRHKIEGAPEPQLAIVSICVGGDSLAGAHFQNRVFHSRIGASVSDMTNVLQLYGYTHSLLPIELCRNVLKIHRSEDSADVRQALVDQVLESWTLSHWDDLMNSFRLHSAQFLQHKEQLCFLPGAASITELAKVPHMLRNPAPEGSLHGFIIGRLYSLLEAGINGLLSQLSGQCINGQKSSFQMRREKLIELLIPALAEWMPVGGSTTWIQLQMDHSLELLEKAQEAGGFFAGRNGTMHEGPAADADKATSKLVIQLVHVIWLFSWVASLAKPIDLQQSVACYRDGQKK
jgi:hypothetical protein